MLDHDAPPFFDMLDDVWGFYPHAKLPSDGQKAIFFRALRDHSLFNVRKAFDSHMRDPQRGRFAPVPADIVAQIEGDRSADGRPGPEEAWAIANTSRDESATIVWTDEIAQAWGIAQPLIQQRDDVGARMAFKEAYQRLVIEARTAGTPLRWQASLGSDQAKRDEALTRAHSAGLLPAPQKLAELMAPDHALSPTNSTMPDRVRSRLMNLREALAAKVASSEDYSVAQFGAGGVIRGDVLPPGMRRHCDGLPEEAS